MGGLSSFHSGASGGNGRRRTAPGGARQSSSGNGLSRPKTKKKNGKEDGRKKWRGEGLLAEDGGERMGQSNFMVKK